MKDDYDEGTRNDDECLTWMIKVTERGSFAERNYDSRCRGGYSGLARKSRLGKRTIPMEKRRG